MRSGDFFFLGGLLTVIAGLWMAASRLNRRSQPAVAFERTYATVSAHVVEFLYWTAREVGGVFAPRSTRSSHAVRAAFAIALVAMTILFPVAAIAASDEPELRDHGVALGVGGLLWALVLETSSLPSRTRGLMGTQVLSLPVWQWALLLIASDVALLVGTALYPGLSDTVHVALVGASYVALADIVSAYIGFMLSPFSRYPLSEGAVAQP